MKKMNKVNNAIKAIFNINLNIKKNEKVLVFTDLIQPDENISNADKIKREGLVKIAKKMLEIGREICSIEFAAYPSLKENGVEPPEDIWIKAFGKDAVGELKKNGYLQRLRHKDKEPAYLKEVEKIINTHKHDAVNAVIALSNFSTSHTKFRDLLCTLCGTRYASMPLFDEDMFYGPMDVDWQKLAERTKKLAALLNHGKEVLIKTPNGTDIRMTIEGRKAKADTGLLTESGSFSNLPAGEAFLAPLEGTTNGKLVLEWAPTYKLDSPVILDVINGKVKNITGSDSYADILTKKLNENPDFRNIAELGIGTNDKAKRPDNILESEKILGTIHIALGDNSSFGGNVRTPFHQDFVFFKPTVVVKNDKEEMTILDKGKLLVQTQ
ncbi:MAG: aminopeptidase [Deltaproteobacteria bacterium]|nr:aminopeptidase [Deltaproteobacteria bacterium]